MRKIIFSASLLLIVATAAFSEQFIFWSGKKTWTKDHNHSLFYTDEKNPPSWLKPDYYHGDMYIRLEILDKPTDLKMALQHCLWLGGSKYDGEMCTVMPKGQWPVFTKKGDVAFVKIADLSTLLNWEGPKWDGTKPISKVLCQLRAQKGSQYKEAKTCSQSKCFGSEIVKHLPVTWDETAICVSKGATLNPEGIWDDCPAEWGYGGSVTANIAPANSLGRPGFLVMRTANGIITISGGNSADYSVRLVNAHGKVIPHRGIKSADGYRISAGLLSTGLYVIRIEQGASVAQRKIIVP